MNRKNILMWCDETWRRTASTTNQTSKKNATLQAREEDMRWVKMATMTLQYHFLKPAFGCFKDGQGALRGSFLAKEHKGWNVAIKKVFHVALQKELLLRGSGNQGCNNFVIVGNKMMHENDYVDPAIKQTLTLTLVRQYISCWLSYCTLQAILKI